ncbi:MAG: hypothetical protein LC797_24355 [Chloroflexi bacterium]|nr:hypothetical protein [Chloroflexota bacterium]
MSNDLAAQEFHNQGPTQYTFHYDCGGLTVNETCQEVIFSHFANAG